MLHEGLGCVALWRDFPARLAAATGFGVFAWSRAGYGRSDLVALPRPLDYMTREARVGVPAVLEAIGLKREILLGHSDGASIAAIYAGEPAAGRVEALVLIAPHRLHRGAGPQFDRGSAPRLRDRRPPRPARQIPRRCRQRVLRLEQRLARSRLRGLEHRGCGGTLARPRAARFRASTTPMGRSRRSAPSRLGRLHSFGASSSKAAAIRRKPSSRKRRSTPSSGSAPRSRHRPSPRHADEGKPSAGAGKQSPRKEIKGKNGRKTKGDGRKTKPPSCQVHLYIQQVSFFKRSVLFGQVRRGRFSRPCLRRAQCGSRQRRLARQAGKHSGALPAMPAKAGFDWSQLRDPESSSRGAKRRGDPGEREAPDVPWIASLRSQ